jgi:excisionase family DNA binding protein
MDIRLEDSAMTLTADRIELTDDEAGLLKQASRFMSEALDKPRATKISLVGEIDGERTTLDVPPDMLKTIGRLFGLMARQQTFILAPESSEIGSIQAAKILGVSRPYLISLLDKDALAYRKVGTHRRILLKEVMKYRDQMRHTRTAAMGRMVELSEKLDGYDL